MSGTIPNSRKVCVLGAGASGLITAYTLVKDGFQVQLITKDSAPGGVWASDKVYKDLQTNNVHGEYRFSPLPMPPPTNHDTTGGRLYGEDVSAYMHLFAERFLDGMIRFHAEVLNIRRGDNGKGWILRVQDARSAAIEDVSFDKLVLCTGGASSPQIPQGLSTEDAKTAGFNGAIFHASEFASRSESVLTNFPGDNSNNTTVLLIGGGKSAQDISSYFARYHPSKNINIKVVFSSTDAFMASSKPLPNFLRKSRALSVMYGYMTLRTRLERFLHTTKIGSAFNHWIWNGITKGSYETMHVPEDSPLRNNDGIFWGIRINDEGSYNPNRFFSLVNEGRIELIAPAQVTRYMSEENSVTLNTGETIPNVGMVILCTGYTSSWKNLFDDHTADELGIHPHPPLPEGSEAGRNLWNNYYSLSNPPPSHPDEEQWAASIYRGIVPCNNILKHDFAINGAIHTANNAYAFEVISHWISSYFLRDTFLHLPSSIEGAVMEAEIANAWTRKRFPDLLRQVNQSYSSQIVFFGWPQYTEDLLQDMGLPIYRSGGNWFTWVFKECTIDQLSTLSQEREDKRIVSSG